jgi:hypothetical protein
MEYLLGRAAIGSVGASLPVTSLFFVATVRGDRECPGVA